MEEDKFSDIGKVNPYKVPEGFFDKISEETLSKAKYRETRSKRRFKLTRILVLFTSAAAVLIIAFFGPWNFQKPESVSIALNNEKVNIEISEPETVLAPETGNKINAEKVINAENVEKQAEVKYENISEEGDDLNEILADLSDEELQMMDDMYKSDPFMEETTQL